MRDIDSAMDYLERGPQVRPGQRKLSSSACGTSTAIEYRATEFEGTPPGIVLRGVDFRP
ncbi:hypothetical protein [Bradyrhizobium sp. B117]|uniref:hypothetical protein n=1 Tax=Bradyrhizobium sp. B117 TaxID=3140246 RepID=UPI0031840B8B